MLNPALSSHKDSKSTESESENDANDIVYYNAEKSLKVSCLVFTIIFTIASISIYGSHSLKVNAERSLQSFKGGLIEWGERYDTAKKRIDLIEKYQDKYRTLSSIPILEEEARILWIETINRLAKELFIENLTYSIGSLEPEENENFKENYEFMDLFYSEMKINFRTAHEVDAVRLLRAIKYSKIGLYTPTECKMLRTSDGYIAHYTYLETHCTLRWFTLKEVTGEDSGSSGMDDMM